MRIPDLSDIPEQAPVAEGVEYDLRITKVKDVVSNKTGREGIMLICEVIGEENAESVFERLWLPMDGDDETKARTMWRMVKEFLISIGAPTDGLDASELEGIEFSAILGIENDDKGRPRNFIQRVV
jgi:hypothetical protein